ncbi:hypothetical protein KJF94_28035 [Pseudomonas hormoni]|uniref:Uncharacterized protein n=1 Tax=Pseudomonas hormoni TaxID=3093767 RepID=A0ABX8EY08_9PSED|nr:hypothetical protein [Pseudomonas hormoni]QVW23644.1 hypothetical protein KJF94_28035 [Pseudomonas hormoni]
MILVIETLPDLSLDKLIKLAAIDNILKAHGEGKHFLWMPYELVISYLAIKELSYYSKRVLDDLQSQVNETKSLLRKLELYVNVHFDDKFTLNYVSGTWHIGYGHFRDSESLQLPILLTENDDDGEVFIHGAKAYIAKLKLGACDIKLETASGGGDTTHKMFEKLNLKSTRFFACIVDSDKDHPKAKLGSTAKKFKKTQAGYSEKRYFEVLECHEIENILPFSLVREVAGAECKSSLIFSNSKYHELRKYPDHKNGLSVGEALKADESYRGEYWSQFSKHNENEVICPGFGENLLSSCLTYLASKSSRSISEMIDERLDSEWLRVTKIVAQWGVSTRRVIN